LENKVLRWLPALFWAGLIFYFSSIPGLRITEAWWDIIARKLAHMFMFGVLALMIRHALRGNTKASLVLTFLYACSDELHQHFVPFRHGTPVDILVDMAGAYLALKRL
jgi:VanZ family protein